MVKKETSENPLSDELLREVDEELKEENAKKLIRKITPWLTCIVIVALLCAGGYEWVKYRQMQQAMKDEGRLVQALTLMEKGQTEQAATALQDMRKTAGKGYAVIAGFYYADLLLNENKINDALMVLTELIDNQETPAPMKNLALFTKISIAVDQPDADYPVLEQALKPLLAEKSVWSAQACELGAVIALKTDNPDKAKDYLKQIIASPEASTVLRQRAGENLALIEKELEEK